MALHCNTTHLSWSSIITKSKRVVNTNRLVIVYLRELVFCNWSINISFAKVQWTLNFVIGRYSIHFALLVDCSINHVYLGESLPHSWIHEFVERLAIWKPFGIWVNWVLFSGDLNSNSQHHIPYTVLDQCFYNHKSFQFWMISKYQTAQLRRRKLILALNYTQLQLT